MNLIKKYFFMLLYPEYKRFCLEKEQALINAVGLAVQMHHCIKSPCHFCEQNGNEHLLDRAESFEKYARESGILKDFCLAGEGCTWLR